MEIRVFGRQSKSIREIARMLDASRNTVRRYLRSEGLQRYEHEARPGAAQGRCRQVMYRAVNAYQLLIIDEIGCLPMTREQADLFFQIVAQRYQRGSMILTSNLTLGSRDSAFAGDPCSLRRCSTVCFII